MGAILVAILVAPFVVSLACLKVPLVVAKALSLVSGAASFGLAVALVPSHEVTTALSGWLASTRSRSSSSWL